MSWHWDCHSNTFCHHTREDVLQTVCCCIDLQFTSIQAIVNCI
eukprot:Gb_18963 [translate_table: standard]